MSSRPRSSAHSLSPPGTLSSLLIHWVLIHCVPTMSQMSPPPKFHCHEGLLGNFGPYSRLSFLIWDTASCLHYTSGHLIIFWAVVGSVTAYIKLCSWYLFSRGYAVGLLALSHPVVLGTWEKVSESPSNSTEFILSLEESGAFRWQQHSQWARECLHGNLKFSTSLSALHSYIWGWSFFFLPCLVGLVANKSSF